MQYTSRLLKAPQGIHYTMTMIWW